MLPSQREHDFGKITVFKKQNGKVASGDPFWDPQSMKIDAGHAENHLKLSKNMFSEMPIFIRFFACENNTKNGDQGDIEQLTGVPGGMRGVCV
jgi:hypothetical protein